MFRFAGWFAGCTCAPGEAQGVWVTAACPQTRGGSAPPLRGAIQGRNKNKEHKTDERVAVSAASFCAPNPPGAAPGSRAARPSLSVAAEQDAPDATHSYTRPRPRGRTRNNCTRAVSAAALCDKGRLLGAICCRKPGALEEEQLLNYWSMISKCNRNCRLDVVRRSIIHEWTK